VDPGMEGLDPAPQHLGRAGHLGHLHVRERWEGTFLCSIYQMDAERVTTEGQPN